jgi:hypothetical protein
MGMAASSSSLGAVGLEEAGARSIYAGDLRSQDLSDKYL